MFPTKSKPSSTPTFSSSLSNNTILPPQMNYTLASDPASSAASSSKTNRTTNKEKKGAKKCKGVRLSTDPQSVAARERRHRISDRFKILQSMVPGGSKMDTVSMLEEAIQYVKYLKSQILLQQTMINVLDDNYVSPVCLNYDCYLPSENFISPQQNASLDHNSMPSLSPHMPLAQCNFQGEEDTIYFDMMPL